MRIEIQRHINNGLYAYFPGQILVDHPDEHALLASGTARPVDEPTPIEKATAKKPERANPKKSETATPPAPEKR